MEKLVELVSIGPLCLGVDQYWKPWVYRSAGCRFYGAAFLYIAWWPNRHFRLLKREA